ncbi:hypothetical protein LV779_00155 [Streptomyces thinghirensis]|nr:hypothetical protein [Streptomyces thinghirensis]
MPFGQKDPSSSWTSPSTPSTCPRYRFLLGFGYAAVIISVIAAALTHYLCGGLASPARARCPRRAAGTCRCSSASASPSGGRLLAGPVQAGGEVAATSRRPTAGPVSGTSTPTPICRPRRSCSASPSSARCCSSPPSGGAPGSCP